MILILETNYVLNIGVCNIGSVASVNTEQKMLYLINKIVATYYKQYY